MNQLARPAYIHSLSIISFYFLFFTCPMLISPELGVEDKQMRTPNLFRTWVCLQASAKEQTETLPVEHSNKPVSTVNG